MTFIFYSFLNQDITILISFYLSWQRNKVRKWFIYKSKLRASPWFLPSSKNAGVADVDLFDDEIPRVEQSVPIAPKTQILKLKLGILFFFFFLRNNYTILLTPQFEFLPPRPPNTLCMRKYQFSYKAFSILLLY